MFFSLFFISSLKIYWSVVASRACNKTNYVATLLLRQTYVGNLFIGISIQLLRSWACLCVYACVCARMIFKGLTCMFKHLEDVNEWNEKHFFVSGELDHDTAICEIVQSQRL